MGARTRAACSQAACSPCCGHATAAARAAGVPTRAAPAGPSISARPCPAAAASSVLLAPGPLCPVAAGPPAARTGSQRPLCSWGLGGQPPALRVPPCRRRSRHHAAAGGGLQRRAVGGRVLRAPAARAWEWREIHEGLEGGARTPSRLREAAAASPRLPAVALGVRRAALEDYSRPQQGTERSAGAVWWLPRAPRAAHLRRRRRTAAAVSRRGPRCRSG